ncbi:MAG: ribbon-helix-helix protein, CopG family [Acidobacteria bacterium]|nr:ribbon-helix-helix protein, CopG family [Acidobacteriota bacterium]
MPARPVQVSMDTELLRRIDADPEVRQRGRSMFIRSAVEMYLRAKRRREIDAQITSAYAERADELLEEVVDLTVAQEWPPA